MWYSIGALHRVLELPAERASCRTRARGSCPSPVSRSGRAFQPWLSPFDADRRPTISVAATRWVTEWCPPVGGGLVARYFAFARRRTAASRSYSPTSQSTNASLYCGEPNFGTWTNSGLVSSLDRVHAPDAEHVERIDRAAAQPRVHLADHFLLAIRMRTGPDRPARTAAHAGRSSAGSASAALPRLARPSRSPRPRRRRAHASPGGCSRATATASRRAAA